MEIKKKLRCILLIDDYEPTNYLHKMFLEEADCAEQVVVTRNGAEALAYLKVAEESKEEWPELIFLDLNMPRMDGWEFIKEYEKLMGDLNEATALFLLTASVNPDDKKLASKIPQVQGFLNKPFTPEKLEMVLKENFRDHF